MASVVISVPFSAMPAATRVPACCRVRRPTASSSAYSAAGAAKVYQGNRSKAIDAGTEYRHSRGSATRAGVRLAAMR